MKIHQSHPGLLIALSPDDCLLLATACRLVADETADEQSTSLIGKGREVSYLFYLMACPPDGYALVADAPGRFSDAADSEGYDLASIGREWSPLPRKGGAR